MIATQNVDVQRADKELQRRRRGAWRVCRDHVSDTGVGMDPDTRPGSSSPSSRPRRSSAAPASASRWSTGSSGRAAATSWSTARRAKDPRSASTSRASRRRQSAATTAAGPAAPSVGAETVLLVDDDDSVRSLGRRSLGRQGYTVLTAGNGDEVRQLAVNREPPIDLARHGRDDAGDERAGTGGGAAAREPAPQGHLHVGLCG